MEIVSRVQWGATRWQGPVRSVPDTSRTEFFIHYDGAAPITITGPAVPRRIERIHLGNGWAGIGYNHVVDQDGTIFEGRGWALAGAHCPNHNTSGWGVQVAVGGDQQPSPAALRACRWLYDQACRRAGRELAKKGHRDGYATDCPGEPLYTWVRAGMPAPAPEPTPAHPGGRTMFVITTPANGRFLVWPDGDHLAYARVDDALAGRWVAAGVPELRLGAADATALMQAQASIQDVIIVPPATVDVRALAAELVPLLPAGTALTAERIGDVLAARLAS